MSSMEVDVPKMNGFGLPVDPKRVHFGPAASTAAARVEIFSNDRSIEMRPKHKARRRARYPKALQLVDGSGKAEEEGPGLNSHPPLSPFKRVMEKDRHSRTGVRGLPKKGEHYLCVYVCVRERECVCIYLCVCINFVCVSLCVYV